MSKHRVPWGGSSGNRVASVLVTNKSGVTCTVRGRPGVRLLDGAGKILLDSAKIKSIGIKVVPNVDKSGFQKIADPYLDKLAKELGPHADKIKTLIRSIQ